MPSERDKASPFQFGLAVALMLIVVLPTQACGLVAEWLGSDELFWTEGRVVILAASAVVYLLCIPAPLIVWALAFCRPLDLRQLSVNSLLAATLAIAISLGLILWVVRLP